MDSLTFRIISKDLTYDKEGKNIDKKQPKKPVSNNLTILKSVAEESKANELSWQKNWSK